MEKAKPPFSVDTTYILEDLASVCYHVDKNPIIFKEKGDFYIKLWEELSALNNAWNGTYDILNNNLRDEDLNIVLSEKLIKISEPAITFDTLKTINEQLEINFDIKKEAIAFLCSLDHKLANIIMGHVDSGSSRYKRTSCRLFFRLLKRYPNIVDKNSTVKEKLNTLKKDRDSFIKEHAIEF